MLEAIHRWRLYAMINPERQRRDLEQQSLVRFREIANHYSVRVYSGQGLNNQIAQMGRSYFQFGDLSPALKNISRCYF
jgi:hypothetical protein